MSTERLSNEVLLQRRHILALRAHSRFVDREEFCALVTSRKKLVRADDRPARVRGLFERGTGEEVYIEEERLFTG
jgi:hypothetical protein